MKEVVDRKEHVKEVAARKEHVKEVAARKEHYLLSRWEASPGLATSPGWTFLLVNWPGGAVL